MYMWSTLVAAAVVAGVAPLIYGVPTYDFGSRKNVLAAPHIVGGVTTDIEKVPFQVSLEVHRFHFCGGSILNDYYVLTAGHCVWRTPGADSADFSKVSRIRAGSSTAIPIFGTGGTIHDVAWKLSHPKSKHGTQDFDIAIIKVAQKFVWSSRIQPAPLPALDVIEESFIDYKQRSTVTGWGLTKTGAWFTPWWLKSVDIMLVPRPECQRIFGYDEIVITSRMLCGGGDGKGGPCKGDSGGPLVHKGYLIGVSSWAAASCNDPDMPYGFANILDNEIRLFIKEVADV